jgi:CubicO group peptidase (beta-lactamase class C family)
MKGALFVLPLLLACPRKSPDTGDTHGADTAPDTAAQDRDPRFDALAATIEAALAASSAPGIAVALIEGGEVVFAEGFGVRTPGGKEPVNANTVFRVGSVTKAMTAVALLQKVDGGSFDLHAPITDTVTNFEFAADDSWAESITGHYSLSHQTGMYDYLDMLGTADDAGLEEFITSTYANFLFLMNPAGAFYNYSNPNFSLAGLACEKTEPRAKDGSSPLRFYRQIIEEDVFAPLGMTRSVFYADDVIENGNYAVGLSYDWKDGTSASLEAGPESYDPAAARPAGFAWSSVLDLAEFVKFLMAGDEEVLSETQRTAMISPQVSTEEVLEYQHYGYGVSISEGWQLNDGWSNERLLSHNGAVPGFSAGWYAQTEGQNAILILANTDGEYFGEVTLAAMGELGIVGVDAIPDFSIDTSALTDFVGSYPDDNNVGDIEVTLDGDDLLVSMPLLDDLGYSYDELLEPYTQDNFVLSLNGYDFLATFIRDDAGTPLYFRTRYFVGTRDDSGDDSAGKALPSASDATSAARRSRIDAMIKNAAISPERDPLRPFEPLVSRR